MRLRIFHTTRYEYPVSASESHNEARLMPLSDDDQTCLDFRLSVDPVVPIFAYDLPTGRVHHFNVRSPHRTLTVTAESLVITRRYNPFAGLQMVADDGEFYRNSQTRQRYAEYLAPTERVPLHPETDRIAAVARRQMGAGTASFLISLTRLLNRVLTYAPGTTDVNTPLHRVLEQRQGVCQDFAHLMLAVCRRQGIPARYISGYLYTGKRPTEEADEAERDGEEPAGGEAFRREEETLARGGLVSGDATHAWVECLLPDGNWHGFDPTNSLVTNDYYVKVHYGRDYGDVPPLRGVYRGPLPRTLEVSVTVTAS